jgi:hypothetical protein
VSDNRFYELLRAELLVTGREALKVRVMAYHRIRPPTPPKLIPEHKDEAALRGSVPKPEIIASVSNVLNSFAVG